ncbi:MAG TPA: hypothetical protein DDW76_29310 [Cyanobacteria bacterium UBA11369]|nr:hypothetical protein [Cyanobacteria bacterium UBA11369]
MVAVAAAIPLVGGGSGGNRFAWPESRSLIADCSPSEVHQQLCAGSLKAAATQKAPKGFPSLIVQSAIKYSITRCNFASV